MRIWDVQPKYLCHSHLGGEHRELLGLFNILTQDKDGYRQHPETQRWIGKLPALMQRHFDIVDEADRRDYNYKRLDMPDDMQGSSRQAEYIDTPKEQLDILKGKCEKCRERIKSLTK